MGSLDLPSRKLYICEIEGYHQQINLLTKQMSIWVQGTVIENNPSSSELLIDDGTGIVQVLGNDKIPNCQRVKKGQYVMIIGIVIDCKVMPVIRAIKVQNLTSSVFMETMWMLEVIDQTLMCHS